MATPSSLFDTLADAYDRYRTGYAPELYDVLAEYGLRPGMHVLDIACGTGLVSSELVARHARVTGIDASEPMLGAARRRVLEATFVHGDAEELPFPNDSFDAATSAQAYHWLDAERALRETMRVVRPGGMVAIWWKELLRGDAARLFREEAARDAGMEHAPRPMNVVGDFHVFDGSALVDQRLRVIPWSVDTTVGEFLGYERSRAWSIEDRGPRLDAYLEALARKLGAPDAPLSLAYVHLLYLGRVSAGRS